MQPDVGTARASASTNLHPQVEDTATQGKTESAIDMRIPNRSPNGTENTNAKRTASENGRTKQSNGNRRKMKCIRLAGIFHSTKAA